MICYVFKPRRRVDGKLCECRFYSGKLRLDGEPRASVVGLHTTDQREAVRQLFEIVEERKLEARGILPPRTTREAAERPLEELRAAFLEDVKARGRAAATLKRYEKDLRRLFARCGWRKLCDITPRSFTDYRARAGLSGKSVNDMLAVTKGFLEWLRGQQMLKENPLEFVRPVDLRGSRACRRALTADEVGLLLEAAPPERRVLYLTVLYTGLRRKELKLVRWGDFDLEAAQACLRLPAAITKNRKDARLPLRPELVGALLSLRPADWAPFQHVFSGRVPKMDTVRRDLSRAGIVYQDEQGRRADLHALRVTFGTNLVLSGAHPRVAQELMRHSDVRLTMKIYTDASKLPLAEGVAALPWFRVGNSTTYGEKEKTRKITVA
jgi:integrase